MNNTLLQQINSPDDLKKLSVSQLERYSEELRDYIITTVNNCGGHLASNLGSIEFTVALHYVFDCPHDKFVFDTGHQSYAHKIITGRRDQFATLRSENGISGFQNRAESKYDAYTSGHSGNSLSIATGIARACNSDSKTVAVIGDGAFTSGMAYEALNDIGEHRDNLLIVLNDNKMSISKNVGAMSKYFARLRMSSRYSDLKNIVRMSAASVPFIGGALFKAVDKAKSWLKKLLMSNTLFESFGIKYYGPFDGHNIRELVEVFSKIKKRNYPAILHLITNKGKGYPYAEQNPTKYHGVSVKTTFSQDKSFSSVLGSALCDIAEKNDKLVAVTAAMKDGTGLSEFATNYPNRFYDVGIAEQHAVGLCAGLAGNGIRPVFAVYSSFLQRGFDQIITDVGIDKLPVIFAVDHSGFVDGDGVTHQGIYGINYLSTVPELTVVSPINSKHLKNIMQYAVEENKPIAVCYPKGYDSALDELEADMSVAPGKWNVIRDNSNDTLIVASGSRVLSLALCIQGVDIVYATFVKPYDKEFLTKSAYKKIIVLEDNLENCGLGEKIKAYFMQIGKNTTVYTIAYPDEYNHHLSMRSCWESIGMTEENINKIVNNR